jgi:hypothetical protein
MEITEAIERLEKLLDEYNGAAQFVDDSDVEKDIWKTIYALTFAIETLQKHKDGLCITLPCKLGTWVKIKESDIGKTAFLPRPEAEAVLAKEDSNA